MALKYLITGTGRCGTGYVSNVLASAGVPCGHEAIFSHDGLEAAQRALAEHPELAAESSWLAAPFLPNPILNGVTVIHLVRHPVKTIESIVSVGMLHAGPYGEFIRCYLPEIARWRDDANAAAHFYIKWNRMIEAWTGLRHRVEDDPYQLLHVLGIEHDGPLFDDTAYNHRPEYAPYKLHLKELDAPILSRLRRIAESYRYRL